MWVSPILADSRFAHYSQARMVLWKTSQRFLVVIIAFCSISSWLPSARTISAGMWWERLLVGFASCETLSCYVRCSPFLGLFQNKWVRDCFHSHRIVRAAGKNPARMEPRARHTNQEVAAVQMARGRCLLVAAGLIILAIHAQCHGDRKDRCEMTVACLDSA